MLDELGLSRLLAVGVVSLYGLLDLLRFWVARFVVKILMGDCNCKVIELQGLFR